VPEAELPRSYLNRLNFSIVARVCFFPPYRQKDLNGLLNPILITLPCSFLLKWLVPWWSDPLFYGGIKAVIMGCARAK